jgi:hypothetical protein
MTSPLSIPFRSFLFGDERIAMASSGQSDYGHTFGGPHDRRGALIRKRNSDIRIHLLHRLDLSDPAIPISIPAIRWLPLYYCFDYRVNQMGYRLISDEEMETYLPAVDRNAASEEGWPYENYPVELPRSNITVARADYDPTDLEDAYSWAGVFGIRQLTQADQAIAKKRVFDFLSGTPGVPKTEQDYDEAMCGPFIQGKPEEPCLNPECELYDKRGMLTPIALIPAEPVKGAKTRGKWSGGTIYIFCMCPVCYSIRVSNQCD